MRKKREEGRGSKAEETSGEIMMMAQYTWHLSWRAKPPNAKSCFLLLPQKLHGKAPPPAQRPGHCGTEETHAPQRPCLDWSSRVVCGQLLIGELGRGAHHS